MPAPPDEFGVSPFTRLILSRLGIVSLIPITAEPITITTTITIKAPGFPIDFSRPFMPERLTPLYFTAAFSELSAAQQLRYNQLHAGYVLEQTIFFESLMARPILHYYRTQPLPAGWAAGLEGFIAEEERHSEMFRALNRRCFPQTYGAGDFHFIRVPPWSASGLGAWVRRPGLFPLFLWLMLLEEERSLFYAKEFVRAADELEPNFVAVQKAHLADEAGHIQWDEKLLDWAWARTGGWLRLLNGRLFRWLVAEYFNMPKRGGLRVLDGLAAEFPDLRPKLSAMKTEVLALSKNRDYHLSTYSRTITPRAFRRFDACPEFWALERILFGYRPRSAQDTG